ncbi:MAG: YheU family protein [Pseudomonadales bacterium]|nr:YheU family protein [Pseudomonadales bacterium]
MTEIPYTTLDQETLRNLIVEIVTRDGTDYGFDESSTDEKVSQVVMGLKSGKMKLVFNEETETCSLCSAMEFKKLVKEGANISV